MITRGVSSPASAASFSVFVSRGVSLSAQFRCATGQTGFFTRLGHLIKEKAKSDVDKLFSGFSKTRESLSVVDELLLYWNLADTDRVLDELEEALLVSDFGPKISFKIVDSLREDILAGKLKSGSEIKEALKTSMLQLLTSKGSKTELQLGFRKPAVIMIVGVNGGGKTTSLGNHFDLVCSLAHFPFMLSP
ncbi:cell division protein FtsY homolog, chloroplastic-like [Zingiber officinale]|uniref:cell division protein FtsY homolog, chloroplastic-like n=1 Tax=Zingiber officinale TaxID=94328 RepID=UPI001C4B608C|nr:cell division protein FtsY homolog, chloroplastic-like [Zingiber officinale]